MLSDNKMGKSNRDKGCQTEDFLTLAELKAKLQGVIFQK